MWRLSEKTILCAALLWLMCCVGYSDEGSEVMDGSHVSIAFLKSLYVDYPYTIREDYTIRGYVISSDRTGNLVNTLVIQDSTSGIGIKLERDRLFETYRKGQEVIVNCNNLTLGAYGGLIQLGDQPDGTYETGNLTGAKEMSHIRISNPEEKSIEERYLRISEFKWKDISTLVSLSDVEFTDEELGLTWCDPETDTNRRLVDRYGDTLIVRTSHRATFADEPLPVNSGTISGILSWFTGDYQLIVTDANRDIHMENPRF